MANMEALQNPNANSKIDPYIFFIKKWLANKSFFEKIFDFLLRGWGESCSFFLKQKILQIEFSIGVLWAEALLRGCLCCHVESVISLCQIEMLV